MSTRTARFAYSRTLLSFPHWRKDRAEYRFIPFAANLQASWRPHCFRSGIRFPSLKDRDERNRCRESCRRDADWVSEFQRVSVTRTS
jgi:hypothetical protein